MKKTILAILVVVFTIIASWHIYEYFWDRDLFATGGAVKEIANVDKEAAIILMEEEPNLQIADVRPAKSFASSHLPGAENVSYTGGKLDPKAVEKMDKSVPVLVYCDGGFRSRLSLKAFKEAGFERIFHLHRGIMWWKMQGGEVESGKG